jgi:2-keto-4-pentenoate hydratase/2-oxohepta-3-ene-1,7-dioic acid hydratase in catechol pathway
MARSVVRFLQGDTLRWGFLRGTPPQHGTDLVTVAPLLARCETTAELLTLLAGELQVEPVRSIAASDLRSPITTDGQVVCQGLNYRSHSEESAQGHRRRNLIFAKAASSLTGAFEPVRRPAEVELLDYEVEIGLVLGRRVTRRTTVTADSLGDYIAGVVLCNDVSARDVMFGASFMQWYQGKSYRGFCPCGPVLLLLEPHECTDTLMNLRIELAVNGERRQTGDASQWIFPPAPTLSELSGWLDLAPGDLLLTGTPGGVTATATPGFVESLKSELFDDEARLAAVRRELTRGRPFLQPGDRITAAMTDRRDGRLLAAHDSLVTVAP